MTELVPPEKIEALVGASRDQVRHLGRADTTTGLVYILHSQGCVDTGRDLRDCPYSQALDRGLPNAQDWPLDQPLILTIQDDGYLDAQALEDTP